MSTGAKEIILADLFRHTGDKTFGSLVRTYIQKPEFRYTVWLRIAQYSKKSNSKVSYYIARLMLRGLKIKLGIDIPYNTKIQPGFYIGHFGGIVVHPDTVIGWNCNISNRVTIGMTCRGNLAGVPVIGNNVYIGPGSVIIGRITIGDNVAIGANSVVTKDIPDYGVVVGMPGNVISYDGVDGYVCNAVEPY